MRLFVIASLLACCQPSAQAPEPRPKTADGATAAPVSSRPLPADAEGPAGDRTARCNGAFELFRKRIRPGDRSAAVATALGNPTWIGQDTPVDVVGGYVPVAMSAGDQVVSFMCLPEPNPHTDGKPWSSWVIYARLAGRSARTFAEFLRGSTTLIEYALCYAPEGQSAKCEHFG